MLPSASALASRREERVQKAFFVDHRGPGDARLSHSAAGIYGEYSDYVSRRQGVLSIAEYGLLYLGDNNDGFKPSISRLKRASWARTTTA